MRASRREFEQRLDGTQEALSLEMAHPETSTREYVRILVGRDEVTVFDNPRRRPREWRLDRLQWDALKTKVKSHSPESTRSFAEMSVVDGVTYFVRMCLDGRSAQFAYYGSVPRLSERSAGVLGENRPDCDVRKIIEAIDDVRRWGPALL